MGTKFLRRIGFPFQSIAVVYPYNNREANISLPIVGFFKRPMHTVTVVTVTAVAVGLGVNRGSMRDKKEEEGGGGEGGTRRGTHSS